jgi:ubiquinone/menaquinone biosynthesis C-methylase UbiE
VADSYDEIRAMPDWVLHKFYETISKKGMRINSNSIVLDGGVGTGRTIGPVLEMGAQLVGIDISRKMLEKAAEKLNEKTPIKSRVSLVQGDVTHLPFRPNSFDIVISVHVLWLLNAWKQAILEFKRVLKAKGYFVSASHNSPEFENEVGRKYLEVEQNAFGQRRLSRILYNFKREPATRKLVEGKTTQLLIGAAAPSRDQSLESFMTKNTRSQKKYVIRWKQKYKVSSISNLLDERLASLKWSIPAETFERLKLDLDNWRNEKAKENPFLQVELEFVFTIAQV